MIRAAEHKCVVWASMFLCGTGAGCSILESCLLNEATFRPGGKKASVMRSPGQWTPVRCIGQQSHRQGLPTLPPPQWSSIEPLSWVIPFSLDWLGIISFLHKKLCKSFHPAWWALAPLIWVDILICCQKTDSPAPADMESCFAKQKLFVFLSRIKLS